ncbi:hypothetical protein HPB51_025244 [Rhipicephalus microplus]|uniref:Transposase protein n=1 Tax=Rhipicephalus microplus TaxID=6941 RepID=A0A9J6EJG3_RHIMP|nr:hypothetical protein HPB51_025244 [Rhipicephalus microplus]
MEQWEAHLASSDQECSSHYWIKSGGRLRPVEPWTGTSNADSSQEERASAEPGEVYSSENPIETAQEAEWLHFPSSQDNMEDCSSVIQGEHQKRPVRRSMTSQTSIGLKKMRSLVAATKTLRRKCSRLKEMNSNLHSQLEKLKKDFFEMKALAEANGALTLQEMLDENDKKAEFLKEQLQCLREKNHRWKEVTIRQAIMWQAKSPCGYEMLRRSGCLTLPSRMTLKRYIGYCTGAVVSSLMKQRLHTESTHLSEREKMGSLIVDEMSLKQALTYEKKGDKVHGLVEMGGLEKEVGIQNELATHLLAFVFVGLSTHYTLPVGYYFTQSVKGDHLHQLTLEVIKSIEEAGFQVVRLVADNHASNKKMFTMLGNGRMMPVVPHPMDMNRRLFLSFDHCHILKNLRNQMLSTKRVLFNNGHYYSPTYLRKLLDITEKQSSFKLVRNLTQKHVYPTNFEKLSVKRAVEVFSPQACIRKGVNPFSTASRKQRSDRRPCCAFITAESPRDGNDALITKRQYRANNVSSWIAQCKAGVVLHSSKASRTTSGNALASKPESRVVRRVRGIDICYYNPDDAATSRSPADLPWCAFHISLIPCNGMIYII